MTEKKCIEATALSWPLVCRIISGVTASASGLGVITLRITDGVANWRWGLMYGLWALAISIFLSLQTLRVKSQPFHQRRLYLFTVFMATLHLTVGISQASESIPDAFTVYGPALLAAIAFLMGLLFKATHRGVQDIEEGAAPLRRRLRASES